MKQDLRKVNLIVIHCSATKASQKAGVKEITKWHKKRGFSTIGYHAVVRRDGSVEKGRDMNVVGAHCVGHNINSLGLCWEGGLDENGKAEDNRTEIQKEKIKSMIDLWKVALGNNDIEVLGHRDLSPDIDGDGEVEEWEWLKMCPCYDVKSEL